MHYLRQKMSHNKLKPGIFWGPLLPQKILFKRYTLLHASMPVNLILPAVLVRKQYVKGTCFKQTLFYLPSLIYISSRNLFTLRPPAMAPTCIGGCGLCPWNSLNSGMKVPARIHPFDTMPKSPIFLAISKTAGPIWLKIILRHHLV